ncbi:hypothetical protein PHYBOEH_008680 [Phytophthora boehmeriae]|uniref:RING-type E3 ubiquitin transferase BRCA1 n=1 Tax=Phytophthora boehmeriae TaxID=109152 RepID=A0A8T1VYB4_9STRA|nr:hypothetical protein PHYBOEH_008680 [Phytophthora boehmeriae]
MGWTLQRLERAVENFSTQLQCAICLCAYDNPVSLPCNHCFCEECIHRALELKDVCPICKTPAKKRRLRYDTMIQELMRATEMLCGPPETGKPAEEGKNKSKSSEKLKIEAQQAKSRALKAVDAAIKRDSIATTAAVAPASTAASTDGSIESGAAETTAESAEVSPVVAVKSPVRRSSPRPKCVNGDEDDDEDGYGGNTDSSSSPTGQKTGKRKLFSDPSPAKSGRWVLIRSLKYLKALVGGRWIVSDEWLQACAAHGGYVREVNYEADGHLKGKRIHDAVRRSRLAREKLLQLSPPDVDHSDVGTMLFADYFFYVIGDFLPPMPPTAELNTLICMGGGKLIAFLDNIPAEMSKHENRSRKLIIVSDKLNPRALHGQTKELRALPQLHAVPSTIIVNYLWVINSISEAKLRDLP